MTDDGDDNDIIFVRALRYGFDKTSTSWVMQSYTGNLKEITCFEDHLSNTTTPFSGNLESIVQLMNIDGRNNKLSGSRYFEYYIILYYIILSHTHIYIYLNINPKLDL